MVFSLKSHGCYLGARQIDNGKSSHGCREPSHHYKFCLCPMVEWKERNAIIPSANRGRKGLIIAANSPSTTMIVASTTLRGISSNAKAIFCLTIPVNDC